MNFNRFLHFFLYSPIAPSNIHGRRWRAMVKQWLNWSEMIDTFLRYQIPLDEISAERYCRSLRKGK